MKRVLTALALLPPVLYVVLWGPPALLFGAVAVVSLLCYREYATIAGQFGFGSLGPLGYAAGILLLLLPPGESVLLVVGVTLLAMLLAVRGGELSHILPQAAFVTLGVVYVFGCWKYAILLHAASPHWLMYALLLNWVGDMGAYYVGRAAGRHRLAPRVSPKKTWEGAAASVVVATAAGAAYLAYFLPVVPVYKVVLLTVVANLAGQVGDLAESAIKRGAGVKDSGTILPGHGGILDRVDGTLFTLPLVYLYLRIFG